MRVFEVLAQTQKRLQAAGGNAAAEAEILLAHVVGTTRAKLQSERDDYVEWTDQEGLAALVERRLRGEPIAYLLGEWEFWSLPLKVNREVLIPRPETELLVEWALQKIDRPLMNVLELGTGSGCIALALTRERPQAVITATDVSESALAVARENAAALKLERIEFLAGDWYAPVGNRRFDLIVSNPPYIADHDPHLIDLRHEPQIALCGGIVDGMDALGTIVGGATRHLDEGGWVLLEHGHEQGEDVRRHLRKLKYQDIETRKDLEGRERVTGGRRR